MNNLNLSTFYRANPFIHNDFIPSHSMSNRSPKSFVSQIPQGQQYYPLKSGKRIFKQKINQDQIDKQKILQSPQKYPFQNRIALDKKYRRNLDTIDIQGASSGTLISQSLRNKSKAIEEIKRKQNYIQTNQNINTDTLNNNNNTQQNNNKINTELYKNNLNEIYQMKRRQLAQRILDEKQGRISKMNNNNTNNNNNNNNTNNKTNNNTNNNNTNISKNQQLHNKINIPNQNQFLEQYQRYISLNSNQKYNPSIANSNQYQGFQRYKKNTINRTNSVDHHNKLQNYQEDQKQKYNSMIKDNQLNNEEKNVQNMYDRRYHSIDYNKKDNQLRYNNNNNNSNNNNNNNNNNVHSYLSNAPILTNQIININNRYRSNPEYIDNYPNQFNKRVQQKQQNKNIQNNIKNIYQIDKKQIRKHNPTNLSFNIAARSTLMSPII